MNPRTIYYGSIPKRKENFEVSLVAKNGNRDLIFSTPKFSEALEAALRLKRSTGFDVDIVSDLTGEVVAMLDDDFYIADCVTAKTM